MEDEAKYLKRKVKAGRIDIHPTENAVVVFFEVEAIVLGDSGEPILGDRKQCNKLIRLKAFGPKSNIPALAKQIVRKCKLIHESKIPELEQLLAYLKKRNEDGHDPDSRVISAQKKELQERSIFERDGSGPQAVMQDLDDYLELLYEENDAKARGSAMILELARNPDNLEELVQNRTLTGALSRVLREDGNRHMDLATNIISVFFFFSSYSVFHPFISEHRVGVACIKIIDMEQKRYRLWCEGLDKKKLKVDEGRMSQTDFEAVLQKFYDQEYKQDILLYVAVHLLLNVAEDTRIEVKIKQKNIVESLVSMLDRQNAEFLLLIVTFLKKLSIFVENKDEMKRLGLVDKLYALVPSKSEAMLNVVTRLLLNLSFDQELRSAMVEAGFIPKLVDLLSSSRVPQPTVLAVLYNLSMDDAHRSVFSFTDCVPMVMRLILENRDERGPMELMALGINFAANARCAQLICEGKGLHFLLKRAFKTNNPMLIKMVRNLSQHEDVRPQFLPHVDRICEIIQTSEDEDLLVEAVGILGNLVIEDFDYAKLADEYELLDFVSSELQPGATEDDMVLEVIVLLGTLLADEDVARLVSQTSLLDVLMDTLKAKQKDDEIVLQIAYVLHKLVLHEATRDMVLEQSLPVSYLLDLMFDKNKIIQQACIATLDVVMEHDDAWGARIRAKKFEFHNSQWLDTVLGEGQPDAPLDAGYDQDAFGDLGFDTTMYRDADDLYEDDNIELEGDEYGDGDGYYGRYAGDELGGYADADGPVY